MDNIKKLKRSAQLVSVLTKYGFEALVSQAGIGNPKPVYLIEKNEIKKTISTLTIYQRIRMALEELGPTYVKLGQLLSNRSDLLPPELISELKLLQDSVAPINIDVIQVIKAELKINPEEIFDYIDPNPIAAASLAQVYKGKLKDGGKEVIIKVRRKGIKEIVEADLLLMKDMSHILEKYYDLAKRIGINSIIKTFAKSITTEMSFNQELSNIERFRLNFKDDNSIYVPTTYKKLSNNNILCMEYIDGIKISDKEKLEANNIDTHKVATSVIDLYLKQVIDFGLFHADPHSGNIFVLFNGQIAFIDYGSVGKILPRDKDYLTDFVIYILKKDVRRLIGTIKKMSIRYDIPNEAELERELYNLIDILNNSSINELNLKVLMKDFSSLLHDNQVLLPDYIYLLIRGIVLLEGIGREICPDLNIIENMKPYGVKLIRKRFSPEYIFNKSFDKLYDLSDKLYELPEDIHNLIQRVNKNELIISHNINGLSDIKKTIDRLVVAIIIASLGIGSSILILADMPPKAFGVPIFGFIGFFVASVMAILVILSILRNKK